jgi:hypothetical protein
VEALEERAVPAVFNVNSTAELLNPPAGTVTLRSAIEMANATPGSNTINLTVPGTYSIALPTSPTPDPAKGAFIKPNPSGLSGSTLTVQNTSGGPVAVDGSHFSRAFDVNPDDNLVPGPFTVVMQGFTIQNGVASPGDGAAGSGGGIRDQGSVNLTLTNMSLTNNLATAGGGLESDGSGKVVLNAGTVVTANTSANQGGGIWLDGIQQGNTSQSASLTVNGSLISNNQALSPGGIGNGAVNITDSRLSGNTAGFTGAASATTITRAR